jgi:hypothetical protein
LCNILADFDITMKVVRLIKMCFNETFSKIHIGEHFFDTFPFKYGLKEGDVL